MWYSTHSMEVFCMTRKLCKIGQSYNSSNEVSANLIASLIYRDEKKIKLN